MPGSLLSAIEEGVIDPFVAAVRAFRGQEPLAQAGLVPVVRRLDELGHEFRNAALRRMILHPAFGLVPLAGAIRLKAVTDCYGEIHRFLMVSAEALQEPRLMEAEYRAYAEFYDITHQKREKWDEMAAFVGQFLAPAVRERGAAVLDLACGSGLSAALYRPFAAHLTGVDLSSAMLALARQREVYDETVCMPIEAFLDEAAGRATGRFDLIGFYDTLQLYPDFRGLLDRVMPLLSPHGLFVFSVPWGAAGGGDYVFAGGIVVHDRARVMAHVEEAGGCVRGCGLIFPDLKAGAGLPYEMQLVVVERCGPAPSAAADHTPGA